MIDLYYWPTPTNWKVPSCSKNAGCPTESFLCTSVAASSSLRRSWASIRTPAFPQSSIEGRREVARHWLFSKAARFCSTSPRTGAHIAGEDCSIADIACFPWVMTHKAQQMTLDDFSKVKRWFAQVRARPAVQRGLAVEKALTTARIDEEARKHLFGASAR